jgi:hypothetical protein
MLSNSVGPMSRGRAIAIALVPPRLDHISTNVPYTFDNGHRRRCGMNDVNGSMIAGRHPSKRGHEESFARTVAWTFERPCSSRNRPFGGNTGIRVCSL